MGLTEDEVRTLRAAARILGEQAAVAHDAREEGIDPSVVPLENEARTALLSALCEGSGWVAVVRSAAGLIAEHEKKRGVSLKTGAPERNVAAIELLSELVRRRTPRISAQVAGPWDDAWRFSAAIGPCTFPLAAAAVQEERRQNWPSHLTGRWEALRPDVEGDAHEQGDVLSVHDTEAEARIASETDALAQDWTLLDPRENP